MNLTPFRQEQPHTCLPACLRMILYSLGRDHSEAELAQACGSIPRLGTPPDKAVAGLERLGYGALWFEHASLERLTHLLAQHWPVILFLPASTLPHGRSGLHALVLTAIEAGEITTLDPALGGEFRMPLNDFLHAWTILDHQGMVVWIPSS